MLRCVFVFALAARASAASPRTVAPRVDWTTDGSTGTAEFACKALSPALAAVLELLGAVTTVFFG